MDAAARSADDLRMIAPRRNLIGRRVIDSLGERVGTVVDTWPFDGGGEVEMVVLRLGRLGERRVLPAASLHAVGADLRTPYARWQVEDSPALEDGRHAVEAFERAVSHWMWEEPVTSLSDRWRSSGSFATARRSRTTPSPTTSAS
jgi:hypothetical protein